LPAPGREKTPKGEANISSLWPLAREGLWPGGKREAGRDFQSAEVLPNSKLQITYEFSFLKKE
jgi:hypothetical protein